MSGRQLTVGLVTVSMDFALHIDSALWRLAVRQVRVEKGEAQWEVAGILCSDHGGDSCPALRRATCRSAV
jgi:hypothetical protein